MKDTTFYKKQTINCSGKLLDLSTPKVMGIINLTPDSFYDGGKTSSIKDVLSLCEKHLKNGAAILDVGGQSTKPNSIQLSSKEEFERIKEPLLAIKNEFPAAIISIDTFYAEVTKRAFDLGADLINDVSAGKLDPEMLATIQQLNVPYIATHMQGIPSTMQVNPSYKNITQEVTKELSELKNELFSNGFKDLIIDPGFGFGKTIAQNFELLNNLEQLHALHLPVLIGISRKSMIWKTLQSSPENALNGTSSLNTIALLKKVNILRVHDVKEAMECITLVENLRASEAI